MIPLVIPPPMGLVITLDSCNAVIAPMDSLRIDSALLLNIWSDSQGHVFCGQCGSPTHPIEAGGKRACDRESRHRVYPRTDPVVRIH